MSTQAPYNNSAYGLNSPLLNVFPAPIISQRAPTTADQAQLGSIWIYKPSNEAFVLTSVVSNSANWLQVQASGGSGIFTTVTASGNITSTGGNISATTGSISAGSTITAGTGFTATTGNIVATTGNINATAGNINATAGNIIATAGNIEATVGDVVAGGIVEGSSVTVTGDAGDVAASTTMTSVVSTTQSTGTLSIKSESGNNGNNTGFLKFYQGTTAVYVPYFATIAP